MSSEDPKPNLINDEKDLDNNGFVDVQRDLNDVSNAFNESLVSRALLDRTTSNNQVTDVPMSTTGEKVDSLPKPKEISDVLTPLLPTAQNTKTDNSTPTSVPSKPVVTTTTPTTPVAPNVPVNPAPVSPVSDTVSPASTCNKESQSCCKFTECCMNYVTAHPKVKSLLLWENPKVSGLVLVAAVILLEALSRFSLLFLFGAFELTLMTLIGGYRLYLAVMNRVKGTDDQCLKKLYEIEVKIPHEKLAEIVKLVEEHGNNALNKLKLLVLWDNLRNSAIAFFVFYMIYSVGCMFNLLSLVTLDIVLAFTLPKIYTVYKVPIDNALMKLHQVLCNLSSKLKEKLPMIFKKKTQ